MSQDSLSSIGLLNNITSLPLYLQVVIIPLCFLVLAIVNHIGQQLLFVNKNEPPLVFSWFPLIGSTITYGMDPFEFYFKNQKKVRNNMIIVVEPQI